jgi:hypothetical protein
MECALLQDFHPMNTGLEQPVLELARKYDPAPSRTGCGRDAFLALLAGVPALRKTPGLPSPTELGEDCFAALPQCATPEDAAACRGHLKARFGITDAKTLVEFCNKEILAHAHYLDFEAFWEGRPPFDPSRMNEKGQQLFARLRDFAAQFYPIVGKHGFLAWDISECAGHLRAAYACGLLSREELDELSGYWIEQAQTFRSWTEYAVSLVCGQLYWDFRGGAQPSDLQAHQELWLRLVRSLLDNPAAWGSGLWYAPPRKKDYFLPTADFRWLLRDWSGPDGCLATDHITVLGKKVGYCYREKPTGNDFSDSGWRFFSGEETNEYVNDLDNSDVYDLNTICNYDPDIIPLLNAPYGTAYVRGRDGAFHTEAFTPPQD